MAEVIGKPLWVKIVSAFSIIFGIATVFTGGTTLFNENNMLAAGKVVELVLWYNFLAGFLYIAAGIAIFRQKSSAIRISMFLANSSVTIYFALLLHIFTGNEYETRTLIAMTFRTVYWVIVTIVVFKSKAIEPVQCNC